MNHVTDTIGAQLERRHLERQPMERVQLDRNLLGGPHLVCADLVSPHLVG